MDARTMLRIARALVASGRGEEAERIVGAMEGATRAKLRGRFSALLDVADALDRSGRFDEADRITGSVMARMARSGPLTGDDVRDIMGVGSIVADPELGRVLGGEDDMMDRSGRQEIADALAERGEGYGLASELWNNWLFRKMFPARYNQNVLGHELERRAPGLSRPAIFRGPDRDAARVVETMIEDRERSGRPMDRTEISMARSDPQRFLQMMRARAMGGRTGHRDRTPAGWTPPAPGMWN